MLDTNVWISRAKGQNVCLWKLWMDAFKKVGEQIIGQFWRLWCLFWPTKTQFCWTLFLAAFIGSHMFSPDGTNGVGKARILPKTIYPGWRFYKFSFCIFLHPRNLTWKMKMMVSKRNFLFWTLLFRFHVKFLGCKLDFWSKKFKKPSTSWTETPAQLVETLGWRRGE